MASHLSGAQPLEWDAAGAYTLDTIELYYQVRPSLLQRTLWHSISLHSPSLNPFVSAAGVMRSSPWCAMAQSVLGKEAVVCCS